MMPPRSLVLLSLLAFASSACGQDRKVESYGASISWVHAQPKKMLSMPPGTSHETFHSEVAGVDIGYCVYLPPGIDSGASARYPVIYNLHGNGGDEFTSLDSVALLHEQIVSGKVPPIIMVLPNGGKSTFYKNSADGKFPIESIVIQELIPHIDAKYPTIADRKGRCIEGFSMGGRGSTRLAMKYPEMFCSLFCQAGNVPRLLEVYDQTDADGRAESFLGPNRDDWEADDVYAVTTKNRDRIRSHVRIQIACGTTDGGHLKTIRDFHDHLLKLGIDHTYIELEDMGHKRAEMMARLGPVWFDYHVESMRRAGTFE